MKLHIPLGLLAALVSLYASPVIAKTSTDLGNVMYIGDSISHGYNSSSHRWELHKIFADNGISYNEVGVMTGNSSGSMTDAITPGSIYGDVVFDNVHCANSSGRTDEVSGLVEGGSDRYNGSNINNWLGLSDVDNNGEAYTGATFTGDEAPDTYVMMLGTNDLLSDHGDAGFEGNPAAGQVAIDELLRNVKSIHTSISTATPNAKLIITTIPVFTNENGAIDSLATRQVIANYNEQLKTWASEQGANVMLVDVNVGLLDVTSSSPVMAVDDLLGDAVHPNSQGSRIIAANIAKAYGLAGRTAGQKRMGANGMAVNFYNDGNSLQFSEAALASKGFTTNNVTVTSNSLTMNQKSSISHNWSADTTLNNGYTLDFDLMMGDGAANGWNTTDDLSITLGNGSTAGILSINEAYIKWGDTVLYSLDMSASVNDLRLSYVMGDVLNGLEAGYYLWIDDMLIGEALDGVASDVDGLLVSYDGSGNVILGDIALDGSNAFAPSTEGITNAENGFVAGGSEVLRGLGSIDWLDSSSFDATFTLTELNGNLRLASGFVGGAGTSLDIIVTGETVIGKTLYANDGNYTGDIRVDIQGGLLTAAGWYGIHGSGTLTGNATMRFSADAKGVSAGASVFGVLSGIIDGNAYLEFSSHNLELNSWTGQANAASVVGVYSGSITGDMTMVFNTGTFNYNIVGGGFTSGSSIGGNTHVYINNGNFKTNIYGGSIAGTITGDTSLTISGGNIYGNLYAGSLSGTVGGKSSLTIIGTDAKFLGEGLINAGSEGGTHAGDSILTLKNITASSNEHGIDKFKGTLSGGIAGKATLLFDNVQLDTTLAATITDFDVIELSNNSRVQLSSFGGATQLNLAAGSSLTLTQTILITNKMTTQGAGSLIFSSDIVFDVSALGLTAASGSFTLFEGSLLLGDSFTSLGIANITGIAGMTALKKVTFNADGTVDLISELINYSYVGGSTEAEISSLNWDTKSPSFSGDTYQNGNSVTFSGFTDANLAENITASIITIADSAYLKLRSGDEGLFSLNAGEINLSANASLHLVGDVLSAESRIIGGVSSKLILDRTNENFTWASYSDMLTNFNGGLTIAAGQMNIVGTDVFTQLDHFVVNAGATLSINSVHTVSQDIYLTGDLSLTNVKLLADATLNVMSDQATITGVGAGSLIYASITGDTSLTINDNMHIVGDINLTGDLIIGRSTSSGRLVTLGGGYKSGSALNFKSLVLEAGARVRIQHATTTLEDTNVSMGDGSIFRADSSNSNAGIAWGGLSLSANATIELNAQGGFSFSSLTNSGVDSLLTVEAFNSTTRYTRIEFKSINDFDGTVSMADQVNAELILRGVVSQSAGQDVIFSGGIEVDVYDLTFVGEGGLHFENAVRIDGNMLLLGANVTMGAFSFADADASLNIYGGRVTLSEASYAATDNNIRIGEATLTSTQASMSMAQNLQLGGYDVTGMTLPAGYVSSAVAGSVDKPIYTTIDSASSAMSFTGVISDVTGSVGGLIIDGSGTVTLSGNNSYSGGTNIVSGSLIAGSNSAFGTGNISMVSGSLDLGGFVMSNAIETKSGSISNYAGYTGVITHSGTGVLELSLAASTSNLTADLMINSGTVKLAANSGDGSFKSITIASGATLDMSAGSVGLGGELTLGNNATLSFASGAGSGVSMGAGGNINLSAGDKFNINIIGGSGSILEMVLFDSCDLADFADFNFGFVGELQGIKASDLLNSVTFDGIDSGLLDDLYIIFNEDNQLVLTTEVDLVANVLWDGTSNSWSNGGAGWDMLNGGADVNYTSGSSVTFNAGTGTISIAEGVVANNMTVSGAGVDFDFTGSGNLSITGNLTVDKGASAGFDSTVELADSSIVTIGEGSSLSFGAGVQIITTLNNSGSIIADDLVVINNVIGGGNITASNITLQGDYNSLGTVIADTLTAKGSLSITTGSVLGSLVSDGTLSLDSSGVVTIKSVTGSLASLKNSGTLSIGSDLSITGTLTNTGSLDMGGFDLIVNMGNAQGGTLANVADLTLQGGDTFAQITSTGTILTSGSLSMTGDLSAVALVGVDKLQLNGGNLTLSTTATTSIGHLEATGNLTLNGALILGSEGSSLAHSAGSIETQQLLTVHGSLSAASITASSGISISGDAIITGNVTTTAGNITLSGASNSTAALETAGGSILVEGSLSADSVQASAGIEIKGSATITGNIATSAGNISLGSTIHDQHSVADLSTSGTLTTMGSLTGTSVTAQELTLGGKMELSGSLDVDTITIQNNLVSIAPVITAGNLISDSLTINASADILFGLGIEAGGSVVLIDLESAFTGNLTLTEVDTGNRQYTIGVNANGDIIISMVMSGNEWTGGAGLDTDWSNAGNWDGDLPNLDDANNNALFGGAGGNITVTDQQAAYDITVAATAADDVYHLSGSGSLQSYQIDVNKGVLELGVNTEVIFDDAIIGSGSVYIGAQGSLIIQDGATLKASQLLIQMDGANSGSLQIASDSALIIAGSLNAAGLTIINDGNLSIGTGSSIGFVDGTGKLLITGSDVVLGGVSADMGSLVIDEDASLTIGQNTLSSITNNGNLHIKAIDALDAALSLSGTGNTTIGTIFDGAAIELVDAGSSLLIKGDASLSSLDNNGQLIVEGSLTLTSHNSNAGDIQADELILDIAATRALDSLGSNFGDLKVNTLTINGELSTGDYMITAESISNQTGVGNAQLHLTALVSWATDGNMDIDGSYNLISSSNAQIALDEQSKAAINDLVHAGKDIFYSTGVDGVELEIAAATDRRWSTSNNFAVTPGYEGEDGVTITPIFENEEMVDIGGGNMVNKVNPVSSDILDSVEQIAVDESIIIDLVGVATTADGSLQLNNMFGSKGEIFWVQGDGIDLDFVTLNASKLDSAATAQFTFKASDVTVQVTSENGASQEFAEMQLDSAKLDVKADAKLDVISLDLVDSDVVVDADATLNVGSIKGDEDSSLSGWINITGSGSDYEGTFNDATIATTDGGASISLKVSEGLSIAGTAGLIGLTETDGNTLNKIETTGASIVMGVGESGLKLTEASSMTGGTLNVNLTEESMGGTLFDDLQGEISLTDTVINVRSANSSMVLSDLNTTLLDLGDLVSLDGVTVELDGVFDKYYTNVRIENGSIVADIKTDHYVSYGLSANGIAGAQLLSKALANYNPQDMDIDNDGDGTMDAHSRPDLAAALNSMDLYIAMGNGAAADKLAAAVAGASVTALGSAQMGDMERQLGSIRNRTMSMGLSPYEHSEDQTTSQAWISAEGGSSKLDNDGTAAGHDLSSFGGSFGVDFDVHQQLSLGVAITAMYGSIDSDAADVGDGSLNTTYITLFARSNVKRWSHSFIASFGSSDADMDRTVHYFGDSYKTKGSTDGTSFGLMYELGYTIPLDEEMNTCWQPIFNISFISSSLDGYTEKNSDAALKVGEQSNSYATIGAGARIETVIGTSTYNRSSILSGRAMLKLDVGDRAAEADVSFVDAAGASVKMTGAEPGAFGFELGAGLSIPVTYDTGSIFLDANVALRSGMTDASATVGYRFTF